MNNFSVNTLLESHSFVSGAAFFTSALMCCSISKYNKLEGAPLNFQVKCIAVAAAAQAIFRSWLYYSFHSDYGLGIKQEILHTRKDGEKFVLHQVEKLLAGISSVVLAGVVVKKSAFKRPMLMTSAIASGYFFVNKRLVSNIPLVIFKNDFLEALIRNEVPNRPITIMGDSQGVDFKESTEVTWLPDELHIKGDLNLKGCVNLRAIPKKLYLKSLLKIKYGRIEAIGGSLILEGCTALTELPRDLEINGTLTRLDINEHIETYLDFNKINKIHINRSDINEDLKINLNLNLTGCTSLVSLPKGLKVAGDLILEGCTSLRALPADMDIKGKINAKDCISLSSIPEGFTAQEDLILEGCTSLRALPNMHVNGKINAKGCTSLTTIPEGFTTQGDLILEGCTSIRRLPRGLNIGQELNLTNCSNLLAVPEDVVVGGHLDLRRCSELKEIPSGINPPGCLCLIGCTGLTKLHRNQFNGSLNIRGCTGIKELPRQLHLNGGLVIGNIDTISMPEELNIGGSLTIENVKEIHLPEGLKVDGNENRQYGNLRLKNIEVCSLPRGLQVRGGLLLENLNITELPEDLKRLGGLGISHCPHLKTLPEDLVVEGDVFIGGGSPELKVLPRGLRVKGDLVIRKESSVTELSDNLRVDGDLKAEETFIEKLGENTHIGGELDLDKTKIENLPDQMTVGGRIILNDCYRLTRIPDWMKRLPPREDGKERTICLNGILIPIQELESLRQAYAGRSDIGIYYARQRLDMGNSLLRRDENPFDSYREQLELLEISHIERPTSNQIESAFKKLSVKHHPDKGGSTEKQQQLAAARDILLEVIKSHGLD